MLDACLMVHAKNSGRAPSRLFVSFPMFCIRPDGTQMSNQSWFGGVLGLCGVGLGTQPAHRPTPMQFRMRKPRSWLTLVGSWMVVLQFALFFALCFVVFSTMHPEGYLTDVCITSITFSNTFGELFGGL